MSGPRHVLILGRPRSGTTLLAELLAAQPGVTLVSDALFAPLLWAERAGGFTQPFTLRQRRQALAHAKWLAPQPLAIGIDQVRNAADLYRASLAAIGREGDRVVGHKLTTAATMLPQLLAETDVCCVYLVRDVRDVVWSAWHWPSYDGTPIETTIWSWRHDTRLVCSLPQHERLLVLRFEDLVADPARTVAPVADLLGCPVQTERAALPDPWPENSSFHDVTGPFDPQPVRRWLAQREESVVRYAGWACARDLPVLGYPPADRVPLAERAKFARRWVTFRGLVAAGRVKRRVRERLLPPLG